MTRRFFLPGQGSQLLLGGDAERGVGFEDEALPLRRHGGGGAREEAARGRRRR